MLKTTTLRKVCLYSTFFLFFSVGVEHGVFLPSVVEYLHTIGVQREAVLGIVLACYWLGCCISSKALQYLVTASYNMKILLLLCCVLYLFSGFIYFQAPSLWAVIFSKIFAGLGSGALCAIKTDLALNTGTEEFQGLRKRLHLSLVAGFLSSPIFSILSAFLSRSTVPSEPGIIVVGFFVLCTVLSMLGFTDLARNLRLCRLRDTLALAYERKTVAKNYGTFKANDSELNLNNEIDLSNESCSIIFSRDDFTSPTKKVFSKCCDFSCNTRAEDCRKKVVLTHSDELLECVEDFMGQNARLPQLRILQINPADFQSSNFSPGSFLSTPGGPFNETADTEINAVPHFRIENKRASNPWFPRNKANWLCPQFLAGFLFGSLQTMLTPMAQNYFLCSTIENSVVQLIISVFGILPVFLLMLLSVFKKYFIAIGCFLGTLATTGLLMIGPGPFEDYQNFAICTLALAVSCGILIFTCEKQSREDVKLSKNQEMWLRCLGLVIGPLWTGATVGQPKIMHSGHLVVLGLGFLNCLL